ncbi:MAG TPA: Tic22 family protein [Xenococcaceae cyanobacterium]
MKSLIRWGTTMGLLGAILAAGLGQFKAWALPTEQIIQKLNPVPVFTITDEEGTPLVASRNEDQDSQFTGVFISQQEAENFVTRLQSQNPDLASKVKVVPVPLGKVYELDQQNQDQGNNLNFTYVPDPEAVDSAKVILEQNGQQYQGGVPLFVAKGGDDQGYLTIERESQQVIPFFFEKEQLDNMVTKFKEQQPGLADTVNVEVVLLEVVLETLQNSEDQTLNKIVLVPSTESIQFLQQNAPQESPQESPQE